MKNKKNKDLALSTKLVRAGTRRTAFGETSEAIFLNSSYSYESAESAEELFSGQRGGFKYSRYSNPNLRMLEERLIALESGAEDCVVMGSGMAAVFASIMCDVRPGDHVISTKVLFSSCHYIINTILPRLGVKVTIVDGADLNAWAKAFTKNTTHVFIETPANPTLDIVDIAAVAKLCKKHKARLIVDNVFAGPTLQKPLELGADLVVYSTTKFLDGHGRTLGGAVLGKAKFINDVLLPFHRHTGPALSPFNAWVILKALESYTLRIEQHCKSAEKIAKFLETQPKIKKVLYPSLKSHPHYSIARKQMENGGPIVTFYIKGGKKQAFKFLDKLKLINISNNIGDAKSLITHPASSTHFSVDKKILNAIGVTDELIRISVGLEDADDLINDLQQALR